MPVTAPAPAPAPPPPPPPGPPDPDTDPPPSAVCGKPPPPAPAACGGDPPPLRQGELLQHQNTRHSNHQIHRVFNNSKMCTSQHLKEYQPVQLHGERQTSNRESVAAHVPGLDAGVGARGVLDGAGRRLGVGVRGGGAPSGASSRSSGPSPGRGGAARRRQVEDATAALPGRQVLRLVRRRPLTHRRVFSLTRCCNTKRNVMIPCCPFIADRVKEANCWVPSSQVNNFHPTII